MEVPSDAARRALLRAVEAWADSRDALTLAQMDERVRPSEQTRERTTRASAEAKRERACMLEAIEMFAAECKRQGAADLEAAQAFALEVTHAAEQAECQICEQEAELEPGSFTPHEHAPATVKP